MIIQIAILKAVTETFTSGKFEEKKLELEKQSGRTFSFSIPKENWTSEPSDELFSQNEFGVIQIVGNEIESDQNSDQIVREATISIIGFIQDRGKIRENIALLIETILKTIKESNESGPLEDFGRYGKMSIETVEDHLEDTKKTRELYAAGLNISFSWAE